MFLESWRQYHWCLSTSFKIKTNLYNCLCSLNCFSPPLSISEHYPHFHFHTKREEVGQCCWQHHSCVQRIPWTALSLPEMTLNMWKVSRMISLKSVASFCTDVLWFRTSAKANVMNGTKTTVSSDGLKFPRSYCAQALLTPLFWQHSASPSPFVSLSWCCWFVVGGFPN